MPVNERDFKHYRVPIIEARRMEKIATRNRRSFGLEMLIAIENHISMNTTNMIKLGGKTTTESPCVPRKAKDENKKLEAACKRLGVGTVSAWRKKGARK